MPDIKINPLTKLHADIEARVNAIRNKNADWLCRQGCDGCCHRLAEIPLLTAAEWKLLRDGLDALPQARQQAIRQDIAALAAKPSRPIVCPMLDREQGSCLVYAHRPVACRTYGFYVQRELGLYCQDLESLVASGALAEVVWGNHDAIDHRLSSLGDTRELTAWFTLWKHDMD